MAEQEITQSGTTNQSLAIPDSTKQIIEKPVGKFNIEEIGASGTRVFGEVFDEEYLSKLTGTRRADIFDEMLRSDDVITMLLTARKNPILKASWKIEPAKADDGDTAQEELYKRMADHCNHEFFERTDQDFKDFLEDALTFVEHGYSLFERVHERVEDKKFGSYIGVKKLAWRSQRTIDYWKLDRSGKIEAVFQQADGDVGANLYIDGNWVTVFSLGKRGDNYEGISALRPIYGNWQRKCVFLKLIAIGIERYAINTPVGKIPAGKEEGSERNKFVNMLKAISSHQQNFFTLPVGWEVEFLTNPFDAEKVVRVIQREDEGMAKSFVANHLLLGTGGNGGAFALGTDFSDQFLSIIENDADIVARRFNKDVIKEFIDFNYGPQTSYPKMTVTGINDKFSKEFAEIMAMLSDKKYISATENLEHWVREKMGLPKLLEADAAAIPDVRKVETASLFTEQNDSAKFADQKKTEAKIKDQLDSSAISVAEGMQENLKLRAAAYIDRLFKQLAAVPRDKWRRVIREQGTLPKSAEYTKKLKKALAETAGRAIAQARNEVSGGRKVEFAEGVKSRMSFAESDDSFKNLPKNLQELITTSAELVADGQFTDIENAVLLTANAGVDETADLLIMRRNVDLAIDKKLVGEGATGFGSSIITGATNLSSQVYNATRTSFFHVPEVLEKIEAFKFVNKNPISPICQDLNGRIFSKNDPEASKYMPPLHHNCKSFIVPVFDLQGKSVSDIGLQPSDPELNKFKTL